MTSAIVIAVIGALAPTLAVLISWRLNAKKVQEIHLLVNSQLEAALAEIEALKARANEQQS